jgi:hypothetical protein
MVDATRENASSATSNVEVVTGMTSKMPVFSGNHGDDWTIWEMKFSAHLGVVHAWVGQKLVNSYILSVAVIPSYFHVCT